MAFDARGHPGPGRVGRNPAPPLIIATILREDGVSGTQVHVKELCRFLGEQGTTPKLVTPFSWAGALSTPVFAPRPVLSWYNLGAGAAWYQFWHEEFVRRALRRELSGLGDAVVYAQGPEAARAALRARRGANQRVVMAVHYLSSQADGWVDRGSLRPASSVYHAIKRRESETIPQVDAIVYISELARDSLLSWLPEAKEVPSVVVPTFAAEVMLGSDAPRSGDLVTFGALAPSKHHRFLLEVVAKAKDLGRPLALDIFGQGPSRQSLEVSARALRIGDQVRFLDYPSDLQRRLAGYRAYVHCSSVEASSIAIVDAMAAGLPIFATGEGAHSELYEDGVEGRFWSTESSAVAATMLVGVLDDEAVRSRYGAAARQRFLTHFDARIVAPRLAAFLWSKNEAGAERARAPVKRVVALDGLAIQEKGAGVSRVLRQALPLVAAQGDGLDYVILTTAEGAKLLASYRGAVRVVPAMPKTIWEQFALPWYARKLGAQAIYSHSECAPTWGPRVLLHVPEDPYLRWQGSPATTVKEHIRRSYQRLTVRSSIFRARPLVTSCEAIADALQRRFGADVNIAAVVALGVDAEIFHPDEAHPREDAVFHLGSIDPRDQTPLVVAAYAKALQVQPDLPDLLIAGRLGRREVPVTEAAEHHGVANRVRLLGYVSDEELRQRYAHSAMCLQPARYEGFGLQPLEALACGAALVVFPEPAVREVVADAALVVPAKTEEALADAIVKLWADAPLRASLREAGPKRAAPFTWAATAARLHELLLGAVSSDLDINTPRTDFGPPAEKS